MNKVFCLLVLAISFAACNSNSAGYKPTPANQSAPVISAPVPAFSADSNRKNTPSVTNTVQSAPATPPKTASGTGLNPAHGQPGHRCDIAEGAPLNSAPAAAGKPVMNQAPPVIQPQAPPKSNARLNPAHGQPGHDCAIAVGQPLKS